MFDDRDAVQEASTELACVRVKTLRSMEILRGVLGVSTHCSKLPQAEAGGSGGELPSMPMCDSN